MKARALHPWRVSHARAVEIQDALRPRLVAAPLPKDPRLVAGADVAYSRRTHRVYAAVVVVELPSLETVESVGVTRAATFPYIPGLLSFREVPPLLDAFERLSRVPDAVVFDGQGPGASPPLRPRLPRRPAARRAVHRLREDPAGGRTRRRARPPGGLGAAPCRGRDRRGGGPHPPGGEAGLPCRRGTGRTRRRPSSSRSPSRPGTGCRSRNAAPITPPWTSTHATGTGRRPASGPIRISCRSARGETGRRSYGCGIRDGTLPSRVGSICSPSRSVATPMAGCEDGLRGCR